MFIGPNFMSESILTSKKTVPNLGKNYNNLPDSPEWLTPDGLFTLQNGYLQEDETPKEMYLRVSKAAAHRLHKPELTDIFFSLFWLGWLGGATPVLANMGNERGLPISCYSLEVEDSLSGIFGSVKELAHLSSKGGGVGIYAGNIRGRGSHIEGGGRSHGVVPWCKNFDSATASVSQSNVRRGASAIYLPFSHKDIREFLRIRRPQGDENLRCMNIHHAVCISDEDMQRIIAREPEAFDLWKEILRTRVETGEPFIFFDDNVNRHSPLGYQKHGLKVKTSNICTEVTAYTDTEHTFVCCLSSMNLTKWWEWKDTDAVYYATWFLEGVMTEFIAKAEGRDGFENAVRFAKKSRMLGLGVLGYHSLLQQERLSFESYGAKLLNRAVFKHLAEETYRASQDMAKEFGEPEWCKGSGVRNTHTLACAPTVSNSLVCGHVSAGIEPWAANCFEKRGAKGVVLFYNPICKEILKSYKMDTPEVWDSICKEKGSVQHLDFLSEEDKEVLLTAREISQMEIIEQAAERQQYMDSYLQGQAQSINLFFPKDVDPTYYAKVHFQAWKKGLKTLYYCRNEQSSSVGSSEKLLKKIKKVVNNEPSECTACHG